MLCCLCPVTVASLPLPYLAMAAGRVLETSMWQKVVRQKGFAAKLSLMLLMLCTAPGNGFQEDAAEHALKKGDSGLEIRVLQAGWERREREECIRAREGRDKRHIWAESMKPSASLAPQGYGVAISGP